jgi:hypothetical protein
MLICGWHDGNPFADCFRTWTRASTEQGVTKGSITICSKKLVPPAGQA